MLSVEVVLVVARTVPRSTPCVELSPVDGAVVFGTVYRLIGDLERASDHSERALAGEVEPVASMSRPDDVEVPVVTSEVSAVAAASPGSVGPCRRR